MKSNKNSFWGLHNFKSNFRSYWLFGLIGFVIGILCCLWEFTVTADEPTKSPTLEEYKPFFHLIGKWRCTIQLDESFKQQSKDSKQWANRADLTMQWKFTKEGAWLEGNLNSDKPLRFGKNWQLKRGKDKNHWLLQTKDNKGKNRDFFGELKKNTLVFYSKNQETGENSRFTFLFLHDNRFVIREESKIANSPVFEKICQLGATKEGIPFVDKGKPQKECIVSGGTGTISVSYKGNTYYVCCSGCRDEFLANPEKYLKIGKNTAKNPANKTEIPAKK